MNYTHFCTSASAIIKTISIQKSWDYNINDITFSINIEIGGGGRGTNHGTIIVGSQRTTHKLYCIWKLM
jgi:hypothetical protein